jgi:mannose-1-phosphate guanylyltransferase / phosphomannomutase
MKAVILVGGEGTRLRPITYEIPKPLIPVHKKPIVNHLIELFAKYGVREVALIAAEGHKADFARWKKAWGDELPIKKINIFFEERPRGTFGGLRMLEDWLGRDDFILTNGDELKDFDLDALVKFHKNKKAVATLALVPVENPSEYGVPVLEKGYVKKFLEKPKEPPSHFVSSGLYILNPSVLGYGDPGKDFLMFEKDIFPKLAEEMKLMAVELPDARWYDTGTLERWERAMKEW